MQGQEPIAPVAVFEYASDGRVLYTMPHGGLTIVDQFALAAMQPLMRRGAFTDAQLANEAYNIAEAMMAERHHRYARQKG